MTNLYADIIIDISHEKVDRPFQYRIPEALRDQISVGTRVTVPFGKGNSLRRGYVVGIEGKPELEEDRIKEIAGVETGSTTVQSQLIQLAWWMRETYGSTMNQALKTVLPVKQKIKRRQKKLLRCMLSREELAEAIRQAEKRGYRARLRLYEAFLENPVIPMEMAESQLSVTAAVVKPLAQRGEVRIEDAENPSPLLMQARKEERRSQEEKHPAEGSIRLNEAQAAAAARFASDWGAGRRNIYLLHGITGSGKTEVYMEMMDRVLADGRQVILLIPEIALTYQTVMRFYSRFGEKIAILHSRLSAGERYEQWERASRGEVSVMIGPRSALFAPFPDLGLIVIDEEHEGAYKSDGAPRYHAREAAARRAKMCGASLVLGSATPSLESYSRALSGEYTLLTLPNRASAGSSLASVDVVDLRKEMSEGNKSMFSRRLAELMSDRLEKKEQVMLFINRRGYSNFVSCRSCGEAVRCPHCDVSLTLHGKPGRADGRGRERMRPAGRGEAERGERLLCHYCGYQIPLPDKCPSCGSPYLAGFGAGTQKLEELTRQAFPQARILRMDADTTSKKGGHEAILSAFAAHEADILIGTQMIVKGHDFGRVTLVGIMAADLSLNTPDYRCAERTFQLLTQAAGRAGRGKSPGSVVIQTYQPEHYAVTAAAFQDYGQFYRQEMAYRRVMHYPPVCRMQTIGFAAPSEELLSRCTELVMERLREQEAFRSLEQAGTLQFIGPVQAPVYKVNDIYRKILYIKSGNCGILDKIRAFIEFLAAGEECFGSVAVQYDIS